MPVQRLTQSGDEVTFLFAPDDEDEEFLVDIEQQLSATTSTPSPTPEDADERGGPISRATDRIVPIGGEKLRRLLLTSAEAADAIRTRKDELYRNEFPRLGPRFAEKCEHCGVEFDAEQDDEVCPACGEDELREPDPQEKRAARRLFKSVNPEGQSLRDVAKRAEEDQWVTGVSALVIEFDYYQATVDSALYREGEIYREEPSAIYRADPLALRPRTDEDGNIGGAWMCPIHRDDVVADQPGQCPDCGAELREVWFVETEGGGYGKDGNQTRYFREEVISWSYAHPRMRGLDGIAPGAHIWLKQAVLQMMDRWGGAFYNQSNDRLPNQVYLIHTRNPDALESAIETARNNEDQYRQSMLPTATNPDDIEVEKIDGMPDELLGQSEEMKKQFKSDIRQAFGISDIHDSELEDAGGLNNEGLQLEVVDRSLAAQMHDYCEGWLDTLMKRLGFSDWKITFVPDRGADAAQLQDNLKAAAFVKQAGGDAEIVDGELHVDDFEVELDDSDDPPSMQGAPNLPGVGNPIPDPGAGGDPPGGDALADVRALEQAEFAVRGVDQQAIIQQGQPIYSSRTDVPPNVQNRISQAIADHDFRAIDDAPSARLEQYFEEKLTQPQGWSIDSLARGLRERGWAQEPRTAARTEATAIISRAREDATAELAQNVEDDVLHFWDGPDDDDVSEICQWLKEQTNPEFGGTPVPMDELRELQREAVRRFSDQDPGSVNFRDHTLHPNERHTHRAVLASDVDTPIA